MNIRLFYHSLLSDWNHGNAHFLRGITSELLQRGHNVQVFEPRNGWSYTNWLKENGTRALSNFQKVYPNLDTNFYDNSDDFNAFLEGADLVIVHEWNSPDLVRRIGELKMNHNYRLLFHDTHHRSATKPKELQKYDLTAYDGVLAFGKVVKELYLKHGWAERAWTWHEAADTRVFKPIPDSEIKGDLIWIGNWGDNERTEELIEFLIKPVRELGLKATMHGVRYPKKAVKLLKKSGIEYGGYVPSYKVPQLFSQYKFTVHIPRRAYTKALPGIPTIRPFEALACGIPLISSPWKDSENLFDIKEDFLMVEDGREMTETMKQLLQDTNKRKRLSERGLQTVLNRHTCAHRVDQLMDIYEKLSVESEPKEM